jgi:diaminohydroxyphosphoribosylaminopyrimidine deaminase/5-amino-6-(5-phosphoribosylamino)uracil reductase
MEESKEQQLFFVRWAIKLGEKGRLTAPPNPWVGCVIVKGGEILAEGFHEMAGKEHAEVVALEHAGPLARGATAYVSLEPCSHHGRTPPCVEALIRAGIKKVVIPLTDPDPKVSGRGIKALRDAGIEVSVGLGREEAEYSLRPYLHHRSSGKPFCILKAAMSIDGKTAAADGTSRWISGEEARLDVHHLRAESQAILIGAQTARIDHPTLTVRGVKVLKQPLRVILDRSGLPPIDSLADPTLAPTLLFTSSPLHIAAWEKRGVTVDYQENLSLEYVLQELGKKHVLQLLVEGGSHLHATFIKHHLADRFVVYLGSCLLGAGALPFLPELTVKTISEAPRWKLENLRRLGNDVRLDYTLGCW